MKRTKLSTAQLTLDSAKQYFTKRAKAKQRYANRRLAITREVSGVPEDSSTSVLAAALKRDLDHLANLLSPNLS